MKEVIIHISMLTPFSYKEKSEKGGNSGGKRW